jgi:hypothetical protein
MKGGRRIEGGERIEGRRKLFIPFISAFEEENDSLSTRWYASVSVNEYNRRKMQIRKQMLFSSNTTFLPLYTHYASSAA